MKKIFLVGMAVLCLIIAARLKSSEIDKKEIKIAGNLPTATPTIEQYKASEIVIEEELASGVNYRRYIASYKSDGLTIYGLYTVPSASKPVGGFPAIVFLHGYLDPKVYKTTERYVAYQDGFAKSGFVTFKPDLRGHGKSEGNAVNSNFSLDYVRDTLYLVATFKAHKDINPEKIGMWGHSNGGGITLRVMQENGDIKAAVIWGGVVGTYEDMLITYRQKIPWLNNRAEIDQLIEREGLPSSKSAYWNSVDPYANIFKIKTPVQIHHGTADTSVPVELSRHFYEVLKKQGNEVELYEYTNGDHNIGSPHFSTAMARSIAFFKQKLQ